MVAATRRKEPEQVGIDDIMSVQDRTDQAPDIIEFICSDKYLARPNLYPKQATLLKVMFLQVDELGTQFDHDTIGEWIETFKRTGNEGISPDIYERMARCKQEGRRWFRETNAAIGRRGSKGHIGGLGHAYVMWHYILKGDPQRYYGIDPNKRITTLIFAGKKDQAKREQFRDVAQAILWAPCFKKYVAQSHGESLTLYSDANFLQMKQDPIATDMDLATFEILPKESTALAGRGPAACIEMFDEFAHVTPAISHSSSEDVWTTATPALDQFGVDGWIYSPSSPWQMVGQFYTNCQQALEREDGQAVYPEKMLVQMPSWSIYEGWQKTLHSMPTRSTRLGEAPEDVPTFVPLKGSIQTYDEQMQRMERSNPDTFKVERRAHWASILDAYLDPNMIAKIFEPWMGVELQMQERGALGTRYRAHGDPSSVNANFGFAIAHLEGPDERGLPHVVFDVLHAWKPEDYPNHIIDYDSVEDELKSYLDRFMPFELTFDQYNAVSTIQHLQKHVYEHNYPKQVQVYERTATAPLNWSTYETAKTAIYLGIVSAPYMELLDLELTFLQKAANNRVDHPTSGPVQTKDVADVFSICIAELVGNDLKAFAGEALSSLGVGGAMQGGSNQNDNLMSPVEPQRSGVPQRQDLSQFASKQRVQRQFGSQRGYGGRGQRRR